MQTSQPQISETQKNRNDLDCDVAEPTSVLSRHGGLGWNTIFLVSH